ncbi:hypothetical protein POVWA2_065340 [Plasmodium ovale wallikeri]|uniref:Uncharacterized protein n=1 Tax=Plasmodium ovale wallikeri TaxID=864142 RepID=A0A1A9ADL1_PLAOA|nr:hypothetical protein POVWA2_065340 [Plasmodium ovale wallikeri]
MQRRKYNCDKIKDASKKQTNDIFIRYKTPILDGALKIINEFKKDKEDGVHYKNLCEELNKYAKVQRRCFREEITNQGYTYKSQEWNKIVSALYITFNSNSIKRLCYLEKDKEETTKKYVLDIHEAFRDFCIEKKRRLQSTSDVDFQKCSEYMSWIAEKKKEIQGRDPNYNFISQYEEYFNIHHNCNYPWLLRDTPDIICRKATRTKAKEEKDQGKSSVDASQTAPTVNPNRSADPKKNIPLEPSNHSKGEVVLTSGKAGDSDPIK